MIDYVQSISISFSHYGYFLGLLIFIPVWFRILKATRLNEFFQKRKNMENKWAYYLLSLVLSHICASVIQTLLELIEVSTK